MTRRRDRTTHAERAAQTANASAARTLIGLQNAAGQLAQGGTVGAALAADVARAAGYTVIPPATTEPTASPNGTGEHQ